MKSLWKWGFKIFLPAIIVFSSCQVDDDDIASEDWLGTWQVRENSGNFAPQTYSVSIRKVQEQFVLEGLYAQGSGFQLNVEIDKEKLIIPPQTFDDFFTTGEGTMQRDLTSANLNFQIDDGSGADIVSARLTR
jgi:hypothetical protein